MEEMDSDQKTDNRPPQMCVSGGHGEKQGRKTEQLIAALLAYPTIGAAAASIGINEWTARRWMQDQEFNEQYTQARRDIIRQVTNQLTAAAGEAVECLREILKTGTSDAARVSAARTVIEQAFKGVDIDELAERVEALENAAKGDL